MSVVVSVVDINSAPRSATFCHMIAKRKTPENLMFSRVLAEKERFELSLPLSSTTPLAGR